jgi:hypothetical protein
MSDEIEPFLVCRVEDGSLECAVWQLKEGERAVALFLSEASARAYCAGAGLTGRQVIRPGRAGLREVLTACYQAGIRFAVLDPDQHQARRIFDLGAVLKAPDAGGGGSASLQSSHTCPHPPQEFTP